MAGGGGRRLADGRRRATGWATVAVLAGALVLLIALAVEVAADGPVDVVAGGWPADVGIRLRADALGGFAGGRLDARRARRAGARGRVGHDARALPALMLFLAVGLTGVFLTGDVFSFYVFFELSLISAYSLSAAAASGGSSAGRSSSPSSTCSARSSS